jgi:hypothetical protein
MFYFSVWAMGMLSGVLSRPPGMTGVAIELSEDVLLEIFDAYRQLYASEPRYENIWNSKDGWFKLTHVCRNWRRLVHLSPSRLHVHLLFTPRRSSKALLLRNLPPFPILVDYRFSKWTKREVSLALAALEHHGRVRGISLRTMPFANMAQILRALSHPPGPELESLEIVPGHRHDVLPVSFLLGSASSLRRLKLQDVEPECLSPLLSTVSGLVELSLTLRVPFNTLPEESLISDLQRMSCLRRLELRLMYPLWFHGIIGDGPRLRPPSGDIVPLPNLMQLVFTGPYFYLEALVAVLAAPSLQLLNLELTNKTYAFQIPHFCRLICDTDNQFRLVRMDFSDSRLRFTAETHPKSVHAQPFIISIPDPVSLEEIGNRLSGPLATVEELVIGWNMSSDRSHGAVQWRGFLNHIRQVKLLQVPWQVALDVAHSFQQDYQEPAMDLLPVLEQVIMDMTHPPPLELNTQYHETIPDAFEPLIAARKKGGHSITLSFI